MSADRPINADVPSDEGPEEKPTAKPQGAEPAKPKTAAAPRTEKPVEAKTTAAPRAEKPARKKESAKPPKPKPPRRKRKPIPGAIKLVVGLVALAIVFIVAVIVGGTGGGKHADSGDVATPAPVVAKPPAESESGEAGSGEESAAATTELGFPGFATDNTTRVGGSSPAENAAAVALAVFPSITASQRPEAVALVDETDWPAAIAAAVLMAPPLRAPLLLSGPEEIPTASQEAWEALDPQGGKQSQGARGFAFGAVTAPEDSSGIEQVRPAHAGAAASASPAANAAAIAEFRDRLFGSPPAAVVVAPLSDPALAMPAAAWAARSGDPVLFAEAGKLPEPTAEAISRHTGVPVYVLGPKSAISDAVLGQIKKLGPKVHRVAGKDSIANALAFARFHDQPSEGQSFGWNINDPGHGFVLVRDDDPLEAAAAAALSGSGTWGPLLLTDSADSLPAEVRSYLLDVKPGYETDPTRAFYNHVWVVGDEAAIGVGQQAEVNELAELAKIREE